MLPMTMWPMKHERLRQWVTVERPVTTQDEFGEPDQAWDIVCGCYANIAPVSAREIAVAQTFANTVSHRITVRYDDRISVQDRIVWGRKVFSINGIINENEEDKIMTIYATNIVWK